MAIQMSIKVRVLGECWQGCFPVQALHHSLAFRYLVYLQLRIRVPNTSGHSLRDGRDGSLAIVCC